ncbi:MAG TPA: RNA methyltransferase [Pyrinomonadaceae bacterium]|nr:RNA methyltransferase [Pyrinomonadaceae bacterium]
MNNGEIIRSKDNAWLTYARAVRDGREADAIFIEGKRQCLEAVRAGTAIDFCLVSETYDDREAVEPLRSIARDIFVVADRLFNSISETKSPQGIIAIAQRPDDGRVKLIESLLTCLIPTIVFLSEINNPSNLGAILRTVEAAGAAGVITSIGSADAFSPKANRAALGANLRIPVWQKAEPNDVIEFAKENDLVTVAAVVSDSADHWAVDWKRPTLLMLGSEAHGLSDEIADTADLRVTIPLANAVESLNLGVSAGILLFEAVRQNRKS